MDEDTIALIEDYLDGKLSVFGQTLGDASPGAAGPYRPHGGLVRGA